MTTKITKKEALTPSRIYRNTKDTGLLSFFFEIQSVGSAVPVNQNIIPSQKKKFAIVKYDSFSAALWQKANVDFVTNKDEEIINKFRKKYKLD